MHIRYSAVLSPQLLEISTSTSIISYRRPTSPVQSARSDPFDMSCALFSFIPLWKNSSLLAVHCRWATDLRQPAVHFAIQNFQGSLPTSSLMLMWGGWGIVLKPTRSLQACRHGNWLYSDLNVFLGMLISEYCQTVACVWLFKLWSTLW